MTLSVWPKEQAPKNCGQCEFSHDFDKLGEDAGVTCVKHKTGHIKKQVLCDWYIRLGKADLRVELAFAVPVWLKAVAIMKLKVPVSAEAIVNILEGMTGQDLAKVEGDENEK